MNLWKILDELNNLHDINWNWVKGHSGTPENEKHMLMWWRYIEHP